MTVLVQILLREEFERKVQEARQLEAGSDLVIRVLGQIGDEKFSILRLNGVRENRENILSRV